VVLGIFAAAFLWMRKLSVQRPVAPFLSRPGLQPNPDSARPPTAVTDRYSPVTRVVVR
jgi:hypothetical protein